MNIKSFSFAMFFANLSASAGSSTIAHGPSYANFAGSSALFIGGFVNMRKSGFGSAFIIFL